jgi:hypothetical protein
MVSTMSREDMVTAAMMHDLGNGRMEELALDEHTTTTITKRPNHHKETAQQLPSGLKSNANAWTRKNIPATCCNMPRPLTFPRGCRRRRFPGR